jgi:hypothetical protein
VTTDPQLSDTPTFTELDYIACILYQQNVRMRGHKAGPRWWRLRDDLRRHWRRLAQETFQEWAQMERETLERRHG